MAAALFRAVPGTGGLGRESKQPRTCHNLVELAEVVEHDVGLGLTCQAGVSAQIPQDAIADPRMPDPAELFLDGLQRFARLPALAAFRQFQARRKYRGEPADRAGEVHLFKQVFASVAFEVY